jgi:hypothetical protein
VNRSNLSIVGLLAAAFVTTGLARPAAADPPALLGTSQFGFPGATTNPASATSAGLALADRWLGDEPFANPAWNAGRGVSVSGLMLHVSRQDLRAANRNFDETPAFFDGAGLAVGLPTRGAFGFSLYAFQPVLDKEANAFSRGRGTPDPGNPPATIEATASARELRAGGGVSFGIGAGRIGAAVEWTRRDDAYETLEQSGSLDAGTRRLEFSGDGIGFQIGARFTRAAPGPGGLSVGVGIRRLAALKADATLSQALLSGSSDTTFQIEREASWEPGASARLAVSPSFRVLAAVGGRTAQRWEGLDVTAGRGWEWKLAGEFHDARDPWTLRFGLGQERRSNTTEPRTDVLGLGFGWQFAWGALDAGLSHRTIDRAAAPNSFEDRIVLTMRAPR